MSLSEGEKRRSWEQLEDITWAGVGPSVWERGAHCMLSFHNLMHSGNGKRGGRCILKKIAK